MTSASAFDSGNWQVIFLLPGADASWELARADCGVDSAAKTIMTISNFLMYVDCSPFYGGRANYMSFLRARNSKCFSLLFIQIELFSVELDDVPIRVHDVKLWKTSRGFGVFSHFLKLIISIPAIAF